MYLLELSRCRIGSGCYRFLFKTVNEKNLTSDYCEDDNDKQERPLVLTMASLLLAKVNFAVQNRLEKMLIIKVQVTAELRLNKYGQLHKWECISRYKL